MAMIRISWWKATEIPLAETSWSNIQLYCQKDKDPWQWGDCIYFFRLSPPFSIFYGNDPHEDSNPLIYIGSGRISQRWPAHREWLRGLGYYLPGGRYEVWIFRHDLYKEIEADALFLFFNRYQRLPLANRQRGGMEAKHQYDDALGSVVEADDRYWWAMRPTDPVLDEYFEKRAAGN